jgi:hypothetical protein
MDMPNDIGIAEWLSTVISDGFVIDRDHSFGTLAWVSRHQHENCV